MATPMPIDVNASESLRMDRRGLRCGSQRHTDRDLSPPCAHRSSQRTAKPDDRNQTSAGSDKGEQGGLAEVPGQQQLEPVTHSTKMVRREWAPLRLSRIGARRRSSDPERLVGRSLQRQW